MGCNEWSCGTGSGEVILPNDPSNNSVLSAIGVSGGVQLSWTYPTNNPYGVAYVNVFRGINGVFANAVLLAQTASSFYFDAIDDSEIRTYFYWIQIVSINGTEMESIGPVSAIPESSIEKTIQGLTGRIDAGVLATSLRTEIDRITSLAALLNEEVENRTFRDSVVAEALGAVQASAGAALNQIVAETATRETADEALIDQVNLLMSSVDNTTAALLTEQTTRAATDAALSQQITQAEVALGDQFASVQTNMAADIAVIDGKVHSLGALWTAKVTANNLIGGFGVYNNGQTVEAGFDVDTFWVGRTSTNKTKPFIISEGITYIDKAMIRTADIDTLKLKGNAVTIPAHYHVGTPMPGNGDYQRAISISFINPSVTEYLPVLCFFSGRVGYSAGVRETRWRGQANYEVVADYGSISKAYADFPSFHFYYVCAPGENVWLNVEFWGADSTVSLGYRSLVILGVRR